MVLTLTAGLYGVSAAVWFMGYATPQGHPDLLLPSSWQFHDVLLNMVSLGFGYPVMSWQLGLACLALAIIPTATVLATRRGSRSGRFLLATMMLMVLVSLALITVGRGNYGAEYAKTSRYVEIGFLLVPFAAMAWWLALESAKLRRAVLTGFWLFLCVSFYDSWTWQMYRETRQYDLQTLDCVENYYAGTGDGTCRGEPLPNGEQMSRARELDVRFTRQFGK